MLFCSSVVNGGMNFFCTFPVNGEIVYCMRLVEREMFRLQFVPHRESCLHYSNQPHKYGYIRGKGFMLKFERNWQLTTNIGKNPTYEIPRKSVWLESNSQNRPKTCQYTAWLQKSALSSPTPFCRRQLTAWLCSVYDGLVVGADMHQKCTNKSSCCSHLDKTIQLFLRAIYTDFSIFQSLVHCVYHSRHSSHLQPEYLKQLRHFIVIFKGQSSSVASSRLCL